MIVRGVVAGESVPDDIPGETSVIQIMLSGLVIGTRSLEDLLS